MDADVLPSSSFTGIVAVLDFSVRNVFPVINSISDL